MSPNENLKANREVLSTPELPLSMFSALAKPAGSMDGNTFLLAEFNRLILGEESLSGKYSRFGEIKKHSRMTVNQKDVRTLASVRWKEEGRVYGAFFILEQPIPVPRNIMDFSNSTLSA